MTEESSCDKLHLISELAEETAQFLEALDFFNPEPAIISNHKKVFAGLTEEPLTRLMRWYEIRSGKKTGPFYQQFENPGTTPIVPLISSLNVINFRRHLQANIHPNFGLLEGYSFDEITWFIQLWKDRNPYAPPSAPKTLYSGLVIEMNKKGIFVFQKITDTNLWLGVEHNKTRIVPVTLENFQDVVDFHSLQILKKLEAHKPKP